MELTPRPPYAQTLRVIGQVLESLQARAYDIVCYGNRYLVRCLVPEGKADARKLPTLLRAWKEKTIGRRGASRHPLPNWRPAMNVELLYSLAEIRELNERAKVNRRQLNGMPDPYSLSNLLRSVGEHVSRKRETRLLFVSSRNRHIVVLYETAEGRRKLEEYLLDALYDQWVKAYLKKRSLYL